MGGLAKALKAERRPAEAFDALLEAIDVHARGDAVHPTPLFECLQMAIDLQGAESTLDLSRFSSVIDAGVQNLDQRGMASDGNAGLVMSRAGKLLLRASEERFAQRAAELLERGLQLIKGSHDSGEADLSHEVM